MGEVADAVEWESQLHHGTVPFFEGSTTDVALEGGPYDDDVDAELAQLAAEEGMLDIDADSPDPWDELDGMAQYDPIHDEASILRSVMPNPNAAVSTFGDSVSREVRVALSRAKSEVRGLTQARAAALESVRETQRDHLIAEERLHKLSQELDELLDAREAAAEESDQASHLWDQITQVQTVFDALQKAVARARETANSAQLEADKLSLQLSEAMRKHNALASQLESDHSMYVVAARARMNKEIRGAEHEVAAKTRARVAAEEEFEQRKLVAEHKLEQARTGHMGAARRLREKQSYVRAQAEELRQRQAERTAKRAEAVLQLKASTEAAAASLRGANERKADRLAKRDAAREAERQSILASGGNPYHVFRQRDETARIAREKARIDAQLASNMELLQARLAKAHADERRARDKAERNAAAARAAAKEVTAIGTEIKNETYMRRVTKTGTTVLDPTSREPDFHPSKHATFKDWKFGLGLGKDEDVLDMMAKKYPTVTTDHTARAAAKAGREEQPRPVVRKTALAELKAVQVPSVVAMAEEARERGEAVDEMLEPEMSGLWDDGSREPKANRKLGGREPSTLEKRYMAAARARQRDNIVSTQVVCGITWEGSAFVASPPVVEFRDFVVGETYVKTFTLTNVSNGFNMFRPQPFPDDVASFFELTHEPPGRMVSGRTTSLKLTFTPKVGEDIITELPLLTQTGPMTVPIRCAPKKVAVALAASALYFGSVMLQEHTEIALVVTNHGALPTSFSATVQQEPATGMDARVNMTAPAAEAAGNPAVSQEGEEAPDGEPMRELGEPTGDGGKIPTDEADTLEEGAVQESPNGMSSGSHATIASTTSVALPAAVVKSESSDLVFTCDRDTYKLAPYSTTTVLLKFAPSMPGDAVATLHLDFGSDWRKERVELSGTGVKVPIFLPRDVVDLRTCLFGALYRDELRVSNRSSVAQKVSFRAPPCLEGYLEFLPSSAFVQAHRSMGIQMKFRAEARLLEACAEFATAENTIAVPIRLNVPGQVAPVTFTLRARLTPSDLLFLAADGETPLTSLDFGVVPVSARRQLPIVLRNLSALPQRFGFVSQNPEIEVQPGDGLGTILPGESLNLTVNWMPSSDTRFYHVLACRTSLNRRYTTKCVGRAVKPPLTLSATAVRLPATAEGDSSDAELSLKNNSSKPQDFEFAPPFGSGVSVEPLIGKVPAGAAVRLLVTFTPPTHDAATIVEHGGEDGADSIKGGDVDEEKEGTSAEAGTGVAADERSAEMPRPDPSVKSVSLREADSDEPWSAHSTVCVPCFMRTSGSLSVDRPCTLFVEVETTAVAPSLVLGNASVRQTVEFGAVPLGKEEHSVVTVRSLRDRPIKLFAKPLAPSGPYSLINAPPLLRPRESIELFLRFKPTRQMESLEQLVLCAEGANGELIRLIVSLKGSGVSPLLKFIPPGAVSAGKDVKAPAPEDAVSDVPVVALGRSRESSAIHVGDVLVGDELTRSVDLANHSDFPVKYTLKSIQRGHSNIGPFGVFDVVPAEAEIAPGGVQRLTITFSPDHETIHFFELFEVAMADGAAEEGTELLLLTGRAWTSGGYVLPPAIVNVQGEALLSAPSQDILRIAKASAEAAEVPIGGANEACGEITLELVPGTDGKATCEILFGNIKPTNASAKPQNLEVSFDGLTDEFSKRGFSIEPIKMSIDAGTQKSAVFAFELREQALLGTELGLIASFGVSQWAEVSVKAVMKGGSPPMVNPELPILLKGYIPKRTENTRGENTGMQES